MRELNTASNTTVNSVIYTWLLLVSSSLGSLSNNDGDGDGDGYENVTLKGNSRCFKLYRAYYILIKSSNVGHVLELNSKRLFRSSGKEKESRCVVITSSTKREIWYVHVVVVQCRQRNMQTKRAERAKLLFCQSKPIVLLPFSSLLAPYYPRHHHHNHHQHQHHRRQTLQHSASWCYEATGTTPLIIICMGTFSGCLHGGRKILAAGRP